MVESRQSLFILTQKKYRESHPANSDKPHYFLILACPLLAGNDLVGTLELGLTN